MEISKSEHVIIFYHFRPGLKSSLRTLGKPTLPGVAGVTPDPSSMSPMQAPMMADNMQHMVRPKGKYE